MTFVLVVDFGVWLVNGIVVELIISLVSDPESLTRVHGHS